MTDEKAQVEAELLQRLGEQLEPSCDIAMVKNKARPELTRCANPADVVARVHDCGNPEGTVALLCGSCLAILQTQLAKALRFAEQKGGVIACPQHHCHKIMTRIEDLVYATEALR